jgi:hypothetical protein
MQILLLEVVLEVICLFMSRSSEYLSFSSPLNLHVCAPTHPHTHTRARTHTHTHTHIHTHILVIAQYTYSVVMIFKIIFPRMSLFLGDNVWYLKMI